ncbi:hypothetical protein CONPUDRAFT_65699 [Coniophora puteana RWD-64-598 SS2]|uniref:Uncharacterized protein n=1 Tax=Coniophora puteana (strain RWD-64-598) TaxID=741705 RepID=A0A5M3MA69_CONPW|nr:uncharacterized protein CONPUDRAFT_65699 [Coniophora puteana RWD-64-598 SS2]EIW75734.1 hypothetical protein CONPUDRAFT_65699 [Coniophora puteana RWD-64-598 SS2]
MQTHGGPGSPPPPPLPAHGSVRGRPGPEVNGRRGSSGRSSSLPRTSQNGDYGLGAGYHEHSNPHYLEKPDAHGPARASATGGTGDGALEPKHSVSGRKTPLSKTVSTTATTKRRKNTSFAGNDGSDAEKGTTSQQRPPLPPTSSSGLAAQTRYVNMLLALDDIPELFNMGASFATWILLAGYVLFPGTFDTLSSQQGLGSAETLLVNAVTDIPLFVIAWICTGIGAVGMCYLWWRWQNNYIWLCNRIFLPGLLNSLAGIISTLTSVFGAQHGVFTATSKSTIIVTGAVAGICAALFGFYQFVLVRRIRREHQKTVGIEMAGRHGEGVVGEVRRRRKARERAREREML